MSSKPPARRRRKLRARVIKRDGGRCFYCRYRFADLADATLDHLVPQCQGGPSTAANLVLACRPCNEAKGDRPPVEFLRSAGFLPGLRPRMAERTRRAVTATARVACPAVTVPLLLLSAAIAPRS